MLIESSTVTYLVAGRDGRRARCGPRVGRMSATSPVTAWERLSLVETCTVSAAARQGRGGDVGVGGGRARSCRPCRRTPTPSPSRMARMASTVSWPWCRGGSKANSAPRASRKAGARLLVDAHGAVALHVAVAPHRAGAGAGPADVAPQQEEVDDLADGGHRVAVLGEAHGPAHDDPLASRAPGRGRPRSRRGRGRWRRATSSQREVAQARRRSSSKPPQCSAMKSWSSTDAGRDAGQPVGVGVEQQPVEGLEEGEVAVDPDLAEAGRPARCPSPTRPPSSWGLRKLMRPASGSGLMATIRAPLALASSSALSIRGWLVPGFWPDDQQQVGLVDVVERHRALAHADGLAERRAARLVAHVRAVGQVVGAELAHEQLVDEGGLVAGAARGVEDRLVGRVEAVQR